MGIYKDIPTIIKKLEKEEEWMDEVTISSSYKDMQIGKYSLVIFREGASNTKSGELIREEFDMAVFEGDKRIAYYECKTREEARIIHDDFMEKYREKV